MFKLFHRFLLAGFVLFSSCVFSSEASLIRIHGSSTVGLGLMPAAVKEWLKQEGYSNIQHVKNADNEQTIKAMLGNKPLTIEIHTYGSSTGFKSLKAGKADLAMSSRRIKTKELNQLSEFGDLDHHDNEWVVGIDGVAVVLHPSNPITQLDVAHIRKIYTGEITNWSELGGPSIPIKVFTRDKTSGTYDAFKGLVIGKLPVVASANVAESNEDMAKGVGSNTGAIGFVGLPFIGNLNALHITDGGDKGIFPTELSVATEDYPLSRRLYVYAPKSVDARLASLGRFIKSKKGQSLVQENGFISQNITAFVVPQDEHSPEKYRNILSNAKRLSVNFRFNSKSYKLDNKSTQDVERIIRYVKNNGGQLILVGFTDGTEETVKWRQQTLSEDRGDYVSHVLTRKGVYPKIVRGFGASRPVANDATEYGRYKNRRVEVWVR